MSDEIQTRKVNIELEVDTNTVDSSKNRFQGWIDMAKAVDAWRIFPRLFFQECRRLDDIQIQRCSI